MVQEIIELLRYLNAADLQQVKAEINRLEALNAEQARLIAILKG